MFFIRKEPKEDDAMARIYNRPARPIGIAAKRFIVGRPHAGQKRPINQNGVVGGAGRLVELI